MANAIATQNYFLDQSYDDDFDIDELSKIDHSLVMSLLEDSQVEGDGDEEMLRSMSQSLEPEITNQDSSSETNCSYLFSDDLEDQFESCCSTSPDHRLDDLKWMDMEMDYSNYFIGDFTEKMENVVQNGDYLGDYSQVCYDGMAMEEDHYIGLWQ